MATVAGAVVGCYPNPDDLTGPVSGAAGRTTSSGTAGSGPGSGGRGGTGGPSSGAAGGNASGGGGRGGSGAGTAGSGPGSAGGTGSGIAGSSGSGTAGGSGAAVLDATFGKWATAVCAQQQLCAPSIYQYTWGGDSVTCNARYKLLLKTFYGTYSDFGVTDTSVSQCATAISQETCADYANDKVLAPCEVAGKRANGQPCDVGAQCVSLRCTNNSNACGMCAPRGAVGVACLSNSDCGTSLLCGQAGTCVAVRQAGASCAADNLSCAPSLRCIGGICSAPLSQAGAACVAASDCDTNHGYICDTTNKKCVAFTSSATTCAVGTTWTLCSKGGTCSAGACLAAAGDGKACDDEVGPSCLYPAVCGTASGVCSYSYRVDCAAAKSAALTFTEATPAPATFAERPLAFERSLQPPRLESALGGIRAP